MTPPCTGLFLSIVVINIAGVEAKPQSYIVWPTSVTPLIKASFKAGPEIRESTPIAKLTSSVPNRLQSHVIKAFAITVVASAVRFTFSLGTPSKAIPRISDPFCNFFQFMIFRIKYLIFFIFIYR